MKRFFILLIFIVHYSLFITTHATIRYVRPTPYGTADGSSWISASDDLQLMINQSTAGDTIWVAAGTYKPKGNDRISSFVLKPDVQIYGGFPNNGTATWTDRNWNANPTILSGDIGIPNDISDNCYHVVVFAVHQDSTA